MEKVIRFWILSVFIFCCSSPKVDFSRPDIDQVAVKQHIEDSLITNLRFKVSDLEAVVIELKDQNQALAKSVIYLDSCQQAKTYKMEKSERRGRFVGGLIKSLFPILHQ